MLIKFLNFLKWFFTSLYSYKVVQPIKPQPIPKPVQGLLSMNLKIRDQIQKIFDNPLLLQAFKGTIDLQKQFNTAIKVLVHVNSDQKFSLSLVDGGIKLTFNDTSPVVEIPSVFDIQIPIDFIYITRDYIRISLVGSPDYKIIFK